MARGYPVDIFARMTRSVMEPGPSAEERKRRHEKRWAPLVQDPDGSWRLSACPDADDGKRVSVAFNAMVRTYRTGATTAPGLTFASGQSATPSCEPDGGGPRDTLTGLADVAESGRRAGFRSQYPPGCGGSNPPVRTHMRRLQRADCDRDRRS